MIEEMMNNLNDEELKEMLEAVSNRIDQTTEEAITLHKLSLLEQKSDFNEYKHNYGNNGELMVTITLAEYRSLVIGNQRNEELSNRYWDMRRLNDKLSETIDSLNELVKKNEQM